MLKVAQQHCSLHSNKLSHNRNTLSHSVTQKPHSKPHSAIVPSRSPVNRLLSNVPPTLRFLCVFIFFSRFYGRLRCLRMLLFFSCLCLFSVPPQFPLTLCHTHGIISLSYLSQSHTHTGILEDVHIFMYSLSQEYVLRGMGLLLIY